MLANLTQMFWIHAITPIHVGSGQGLGFIDLPIMREKISKWPMIPGSTIKGVMRDTHSNSKQVNNEIVDRAFGSEGANENAGSLVFSDARIVLLPVRSFYGTYAYVTSPLVLQLLKRNLEAAGLTDIPVIPMINPASNQVVHGKDSVLVHEQQVYLEEIDFEAVYSEENDAWANLLSKSLLLDDSWKQVLSQRLVIIPDNSFAFYSETGTEVQARIKIDEATKVVKERALWYEEQLPTEAVLAGFVWCDKVFGTGSATSQTIMHTLCKGEQHVQIGGKASVGKGRVRLCFGGAENAH